MVLFSYIYLLVCICYFCLQVYSAPATSAPAAALPVAPAPAAQVKSKREEEDARQLAELQAQLNFA